MNITIVFNYCNNLKRLLYRVVNKNIIVTGGAGYIGSHACKALHQAGYNPITIDNLSHGFASLVKWGALEQGDICDSEWAANILREYSPLAVMHFAGLINVAESVANPKLYMRNNVEGTLSLLAAMKQENINNLIFSSSCAVHGNIAQASITEESPCNPINPYGKSKSLAEQAIEKSGLNAVILRYFNAAGADAEGETGEMHNPETHLIPLAIDAAIHGKSFSVFGNDYDTEDGTAIRDYIHVSDIASAHLLALAHLINNSGLYTVNIGTGKGISVTEVISAIEKIMGLPINKIYCERRAGDPPILIANNDRAKKLLGFTPTHSSIENIIKTAWKWQLKTD